MTDYKEERNGEMEALESIYVDEMEVVTTQPFHSFILQVQSTEDQSYGQQDQDPISLELLFTYTAKYPDEAPVMEIKSFENIDQEHADEVVELMKEQAEENLGMVMIFTIVSAVQERLHDIGIRIKEHRENEEDRKRKEEEEAEQKRFEGTRVTVDTFMAWKAKFDAEVEELNRRKGKKAKVTKGATGREMFLTDHTMDDSDVKFLDDGDAERVEVDESLFQDLDDLDLDADVDLET